MNIEFDKYNDDSGRLSDDELVCVTAIAYCKFIRTGNSIYASYAIVIVGKYLKHNSKLKLRSGKYFSKSKAVRLAKGVTKTDFKQWTLGTISDIICKNYIVDIVVIQFPEIDELNKFSTNVKLIHTIDPKGVGRSLKSVYSPKRKICVRLKHINNKIVSSKKDICVNNDSNRSITMAICISNAYKKLHLLINRDMRLSKYYPKIYKLDKPSNYSNRKNLKCCPTCNSTNIINRKNSKGWILYDAISGNKHVCN